MQDPVIQQQIRSARGKFVAMAASYSLGAFNDNFFKQAAALLAIGANHVEYQGWMLFLFTAPYILLAAPAGWLADRFAKRHVVIGAKGLEVAAMICGAAGLLTGSWTLIIAMVCTMGLQSCIFGPSLNGSIPELYPASYVTTANGVLKVFVTAAILLGFTAGGIALDCEGALAGFPAGRMTVAAIALGVAVLGFAASFGVPRRLPAMHTPRPFPWTGPFDTVRSLGACFKDNLLGTVILADMFVWFMGSLMNLVINVLGANELACGATATSGLIAAELSGLAAGGLLAGRVAKGQRWYRVLVPAALGMAGAMACVWLSAATLTGPARYWAILAALVLAGACGGLFMIPCESFIQVRPAGDRRGQTIASANFMVFIGIMASGPLANWLNANITPSVSFAILGAFSLVAAVLLRLVLAGRKYA